MKRPLFFVDVVELVRRGLMAVVCAAELVGVRGVGGDGHAHGAEVIPTGGDFNLA